MKGVAVFAVSRVVAPVLTDACGSTRAGIAHELRLNSRVVPNASLPLTPSYDENVSADRFQAHLSHPCPWASSDFKGPRSPTGHTGTPMGIRLKL